MVDKFYGIVSVVVDCASCRTLIKFNSDEITTYDDYIVDKETLEPKRCKECGNKLFK